MSLRKPSSSLRVAVILLVAALASCGHEEVPVPETPVFRDIVPEQTELTIARGGSVMLDFSVQDPDFAFDYDAFSPSFQVVLRSDGRTPEYYAVTKVEKGSAPGAYSATVTDLGIEPDYCDEVQIGLRFGAGTAGEYCIFSRSFTLKTEGTEGLIVRTGLPIIYLNTEQEVTSKEDYVSGTFRINGRGVADGLDEVTCQVKGRGNTTWAWPKKPYLVKFDKKQSLFGMPKHKRYILLANFMDRTMMRNLIAMRVSSMTGLDWTPHCRSVELVMNGKHVGNYLLIEQVRVDKDRVPVTEMTPEDVSGDALTGGYLLELDFHYDNAYQWLSPYGRSGYWAWGDNNVIPFGIKYPDEDEIKDEQVAYIKKYVDDAAAVLYGDGFKDPETGYGAWIDVDSFIDYWIVFEVMGNHELGNPGSVYMHKDRGGKLVAGPCWDFDWGILSYRTSPAARTGLINDKAIWYQRLFQDPAFRTKVKARFEELLPKLETIPDYIDEMEKTLEKSASLNFAMWNPAEDASQNGGSIINGDENLTFNEAVARLKSIYIERLETIRTSL